MAGPELTIVAPEPGDVIHEKYRLAARIGGGGMGVVYEALHLRLGQVVAIKFLLPRAGGSFSRGRFEREGRAAARMRSANVVRVLDVDETDEGIPFIVMELLSGRDLAAEIAARGAIPWREAVGYTLDAARALAEVHEARIIHRDLKPSNVFLATSGAKRVVTLLDFGISKIDDGPDEKLTASDTALGTPHYMSPEQTRSSRSVDARTDVWSLGVILYELVTGVLPFPGPGIAAAIAQIAADPPLPLADGIEARRALETVIARALAKDVAHRYPTMRDFAGALEALLASNADAENGESAPGAFANPIRSRPRPKLAWIGIGIVAAIGLAAAAASRNSRPREERSFEAHAADAISVTAPVAAPSTSPPTATAIEPAKTSASASPPAPKHAPRASPLATTHDALAPDPNPPRL